MIGQIDGCISTGKEANVYHSTSTNSEKHYAIKVFKTSILVFKDRDRYVTGEFRYLFKSTQLVYYFADLKLDLMIKLYLCMYSIFMYYQHK